MPTLDYSFTSTGNKTVKVVSTDASGNCIAQSELIIYVYPPLSFSLSTDNTHCNGSVGNASVSNITGGSGNYSVEWNNGTIGTSLSNLSAGSYSVTVTSQDGCEKSQSFAISNQGGIPSVTGSASAVSCNGEMDGSININISGGTSPYQIAWNNGLSGTSINNLSVGTYTCTVTDNYGCVKQKNFTVSQPSNLAISQGTVFQSTCGQSNGSASVNTSGGTSPRTIYWSNGMTGTSISNVLPDVYTATVIDDNGCSKSIDITITEQNSNLSVSGTVNHATCNQTNGSISVSVTGASGGYSRLWSTGATGSSISNLVGDTYTIWVTDGAGCEESAIFTVNQPDNIGVSILTTDASACNTSNGMAALTITGGSGNNNVQWGTTPSQTGLSANNLSAGSYNVTVNDNNGCSEELSFAIGANTGQLPTADFTYSVANQTVSFNNTSSNANSYNWGFGNGTNNTTSNPSLNYGSDGTYTVCLTATSTCAYEDVYCTDITIVTPDLCTAAELFMSTTSTYCGESNGTVSVVVSGMSNPYIYSWSNGSSNSSSLNGLAAGNYTVTVSDSNNCQVSQTIAVGSSNPLSVTNAIVNHTTCNIANGSLEVILSGGASPYTYYWSHDANLNSNTLNNLSDGTYTLYVEDGQGCGFSDSFTINDSEKPIIEVVSYQAESCDLSNGVLELNAIGGQAPYNFSIYNFNTNSNMNGSSFTNLSGGNYASLVIDANGCSGNQFITIGEISPLSIDDSNLVLVDNSCDSILNSISGLLINGGMGALSYDWRNAQNNSVANTLDVYALPNGTYTLTVMDTEGCLVNSSPYTINASIPISVNDNSLVISKEHCGQGDASISGLQVNGDSPFTYEWFDESGASVGNNMNLNNITSGVYQLLITDANTCVISAGPFTVQEHQGAFVDINTAVIDETTCGANDGAITGVIVQGEAPFTYEWSTNTDVLIGNNIDLNNVEAGSYSIKVTDNYGCDMQSNLIIVGNDPGVLLNTTNVQIIRPICGDNGGAITGLSLVGGASTMEWKDDAGNTVGNNLDLYNVGAGYYTIYSTDIEGCASSLTFELIDVDGPIIVNSSVIADTCSQLIGAITGIDVIAYSDALIYDWGFGQTIESDILNLPTGDYTVTVTDENACTTEQTFTVGNVEYQATPNFWYSVNDDSLFLTNISTDASTILWDFGDGNTSNDLSPYHIYTQSDTYEVCLTVGNDCLGDSTHCESVLIECDKTFYLDNDNDGYGQNTNTIIACQLPAGYAELGEDCDDVDPDINPGVFGSCCAPGITLSGANGQTNYNAEIYVSSSTVVFNNQNVNYYAGEYIDLNPGFEVLLGGQFLAEIQPCFSFFTGDDTGFYMEEAISDDALSVAFNQKESMPIDIRIIDITGAIVFEKILPASKSAFYNLSDYQLTKGIYLVEAYSESLGRVTQRMIIR